MNYRREKKRCGGGNKEGRFVNVRLLGLGCMRAVSGKNKSEDQRWNVVLFSSRLVK